MDRLERAKNWAKEKRNAQSREEVIKSLKRSGIPTTDKNIKYEMRVQKLEDEGMTRSDAQGAAEVEGF
jgi:hypothetical protein